FSIWNMMMGSSLLSVPWAFQQAGLAQSLIVHFLMATIAVYTAYIILKCADKLSSKQMPELIDMCVTLIGPWTTWLNIIASGIVLGGALVVYWILMVQLLYRSINSIYYFAEGGPLNQTFTKLQTEINKSECSSPSDTMELGKLPCNCFTNDLRLQLTLPDWWQRLVLPFVFIPFFLPLLQLRRITFFARLGALGTFSVAVLVIAVLYKCATWGFNMNFVDPTNVHYIPQFRSSVASLSGVLAMAFFLHNSLITIFKHNEHQKNNVRDLLIGYTLAFLTYLVIAIGVYLSFPYHKFCIKQNFLDNLSFGDEVALAADVVLFVRMLTVFPMVAYIFRVQVFTAIMGVDYPGKWRLALFNILLIAACVMAAVFFPNVGDIIRYAGAFCGMIIMFVLPCAVQYIMKRRQGPVNMGQLLILIFISLVGIVNFVAQFFL
uniref:Neutral amino acid transporter 9 n=1 Tax=Ciona savignyi TaxID=51511 RepID=H2YWF2_CIOSA